MYMSSERCVVYCVCSTSLIHSSGDEGNLNAQIRSSEADYSTLDKKIAARFNASRGLFPAYVPAIGLGTGRIIIIIIIILFSFS